MTTEAALPDPPPSDLVHFYGYCKSLSWCATCNEEAPCAHGSNYLDNADFWHCLTCPRVWPLDSDPEGRGPDASSALSKESVMTPDTVGRVPNKPKTPLRSFRIPEDVYRRAQEKAAERGETLSDVVRKALERYGKRK